MKGVNKMYQLIAVDMDGTLLKEDKTISDRTKKAIRGAIDKGVKVVLASGRPIEGLNRYLEEFDIALIKPTLTKLYEHIVSSHHDIIDEINDKKILSDELTKKMNDVISSFIQTIK